MDSNNNTEEALQTYRIPKNYKTDSTFRNIRIPYLAESVIISVVVGYLLSRIPFQLTIRISIIALSTFIIFMFFIHGFHDTTMLRFALCVIIFVSRRKKYHIRKMGENDVETYADRADTGKTEKSISANKKFQALFPFHKESN